jgi:hypothetical protein
MNRQLLALDPLAFRFEIGDLTSDEFFSPPRRNLAK